MDDIHPAMDWTRFDKFRSLFETYQIFPLLGVIPNNKDQKLIRGCVNEDFWEVIRSLKQQGWAIAQHGFEHIYHTNESGLLRINQRSEFAGLSYESQLTKINLGKQIFAEQCLVSDIWMAPAHSYDLNTLQALKEVGFKYITDGYSLFPYERLGLKFIPCQFSFPIKMPVGIYTVCIHSDEATNDYLDKLERFIKKYRFCCVSYFEVLTQIVHNEWWNILSEQVVLQIRSFRRNMQ